MKEPHPPILWNIVLWNIVRMNDDGGIPYQLELCMAREQCNWTQVEARITRLRLALLKDFC